MTAPKASWAPTRARSLAVGTGACGHGLHHRVVAVLESREDIPLLVPDEWVEHVDFAILERVQSRHVVPDLRERESDIVWRLRVRGAWVSVYLLIELQPSVEQMMALRVVVYKGLLLLDLVKAKQVPASGPLPTVVPLGWGPWARGGPPTGRRGRGLARAPPRSGASLGPTPSTPGPCSGRVG